VTGVQDEAASNHALVRSARKPQLGDPAAKRRDRLRDSDRCAATAGRVIDDPDRFKCHQRVAGGFERILNVVRA
jgi:hypothetical protein